MGHLIIAALLVLVSLNVFSRELPSTHGIPFSNTQRNEFSGTDATVNVKWNFPDNSRKQAPGMSILRLGKRSVLENATNGDILDMKIDGIIEDVSQTMIEVLNNSLEDPASSSNKARDVWIAYGQMGRKITRSLISKILSELIQSDNSDISITLECQGILLRFIQDLYLQKTWVAKMIDATGKIPSGILDGGMMSLGAYDMCLDVSLKDDRNPEEEITRGQYCMMKVKPPLPPKRKYVKFGARIFNFTKTPIEESFIEELVSKSGSFLYEVSPKIGICLPSLCTTDDVATILDAIGKKMKLKVDISYCVTKQPWTFTNLQILLLAICGFLCLSVTIGTAGDIIHQKIVNEKGTHGLLIRICQCFSIAKNTKNLLDTNTNNKCLPAIHGVRVLAMAWVILAHTYSYIHYAARTQNHFLNFPKHLAFQGIQNGYLNVETFFLIGGLVMTYKILQAQQTGVKINNFSVVFLRYLRLTPSILGVIAFVFVWPNLGSGPIWKEIVDPCVDQCKRNWWINVLFVANWFKTSDICLIHFWYLSADMQLFLLLLIPVAMLYRKPRAAFVLLTLAGVSGVTISCLIMYFFELPPTQLFIIAEQRILERQIALLYFLPFCHIPVYCIGIALGYIIFYKKDTMTIHKVFQVSLWCASIAGCWTVLWITYDWNNGVPVSPFEGYFYGATHKSVWALSVSWIIYACVTGRGGFVNTILSWKALIPLSRLSYMMYLTHLLAIWFRMAIVRSPLSISHYTLVCEFIVNMVISVIISYVVHLLIEAPFVALTKLFLWKPNPENSKDSLKSETS